MSVPVGVLPASRKRSGSFNSQQGTPAGTTVVSRRPDSMTSSTPEDFQTVEPLPLGRLPRSQWQARQQSGREAADADGEELTSRGCPSQPYDRMELFIPILGSGFGHVDARDSLLAALSAVGDFIAECRRRGHVLPPIGVTFCLDDEEEVLASDI